jgi:hypothetical protein
MTTVLKTASHSEHSSLNDVNVEYLSKRSFSATETIFSRRVYWASGEPQSIEWRACTNLSHSAKRQSGHRSQQ